MKFRPRLERFDEKWLLSAGPLTARIRDGGLLVSADRRARPSPDPDPGLILNRITNPTGNVARLVPPFDQVLVQASQPVPGQVYNVLSLSLRNSTARTFDASNGFAVKVTGQTRSFPVLTGTQQWKPGEFKVFYILTKKYYPLRPIVGAGFQFNFTPGQVAIPGPSGIFLRLRYNPDTFARTLDRIVAFGPGTEGGRGVKFGLPVTSLWEFLSAKTDLVPL